MAYQFVPNTTYSFDVYPSAVIGNDFKNVVVMGVLSYQAAIGFSDINAVQATVFSSLPAGTPDRPEDYEYLLLRTVSGQTTVLARQWINEATVVAVTNSKVIAVIEGAGSADLEEIRAALEQNGFTQLSLSVSN